MVEKIISEPVTRHATDDLTQVRGIGPAVEKHLHAAGIFRFDQLAVTRPEKLAGVLNDLVGFTEERITTQDWIGQAQRLATEAGEREAKGDEMNTQERQHYAVYTVELLLDTENQVRRTRTTYVQTQQEVSWAGWDEDRLRGFFVESAGLHLPEPLPPVAPETAGPAAEPEPFAKQKAGMARPGLKQLGTPMIQKVTLLSSSGEQAGNMVASGEAFDMRLDLDLGQMPISAGERLGYRVTVFAKPFGSRQRLLAGQNEGWLEPLESAQIAVQGNPLTPGEYLLDALVAIRPLSQADRPENQRMAYVEGILVYVR